MKKKSPKQKNPRGACGADNNPWRHYEVTVHRTDCLYTRILTKARSNTEAENKAEGLAALQEDWEWNVGGRALYAVHVENVKEGGKGND